MLYLRIALLVLAGVLVLVAVRAAWKALAGRVEGADTLYNVGRQQATVARRVAWLRSAVFLALAMVLVLTVAFLPDSAEPDPIPTPTSTAAATTAPATATATAQPPTPTATATDTATPLPAEPTPAPSATPEPTPSATPTITPTVVPTARVNSIGGLYLRDVPGGSAEIELLPDGTVLELLDGTQEAGDFTWQRVRAPSGNEGWVALPFITFPDAAPPPEP